MRWLGLRSSREAWDALYRSLICATHTQWELDNARRWEQLMEPGPWTGRLDVRQRRATAEPCGRCLGRLSPCPDTCSIPTEMVNTVRYEEVPGGRHHHP